MIRKKIRISETLEPPNLLLLINSWFCDSPIKMFKRQRFQALLLP